MWISALAFVSFVVPAAAQVPIDEPCEDTFRNPGSFLFDAGYTLALAVVFQRPSPAEVREARLEQPRAIARARATASIDEIPKLWTLERTGAAPVWNPAPSAYGRMLANVGDVDGRGGDDLLVGERVRRDSSFGVVELVPGESEAAGRRLLRPFHVELARSVGALGDLNRDDVPDFAIVWQDLSLFPPVVDVWTSKGVAFDRARFSEGLARPGSETVAPLRGVHADLDGDGWSDVVVASSNLETTGAGTIVSSRTGEPLADLHRDSHGAEAWWSCAQIVSAERWIAISAPFEADGRGCVRVWSAATRELTLELEGGDGIRFAGAALATLGPDLLAIGSPWSGGDARGVVHVVDVRDGRVVRSLNGASDRQHFGANLDGDSDLDGDGVLDLVVGAPASLWTNGSSGAVEILCGRTGTSLLRIEGPATDGCPWDEESVECEPPQCRCAIPEQLGEPIADAFGFAVETGDFDADGLADLAIGHPSFATGGVIGRVHALSGFELRTRIERAR